MITLQKEVEQKYLLTGIIYKLHKISDKLSFFEAKYKTNFIEFEEEIKNRSEENVEMWEDYIQWKAYQKSLFSMNREKTEVENGHFKFS
ncbi:MAG: hypothetical protein HYV28_00455 [Ignavibacteriales bacterium]|nr:hypothetical protein [Ignavibacteriales bacterium]